MEAMLEGICPAAMVEKLWQCGDSLLLLRHGMQGQVLGAVSYRQLESRELYDRLGSLELSGYVRQKAGVGRCSSADCGCRTATSSGSWAAAADGGVYHGTGAGVSPAPCMIRCPVQSTAMC